jgi:ribosomal protein S14
MFEDGTDRPDPEDDPTRCSICGQPLGTVKRIEGDDHCDICIREYVGEHAVSGGVR